MVKVYWDWLKSLALVNATTGHGFCLRNLMPASHVLTTVLISNDISFVNNFALPIDFCLFSIKSSPNCFWIFFIWTIFASFSSVFSDTSTSSCGSLDVKFGMISTQ